MMTRNQWIIIGVLSIAVLLVCSLGACFALGFLFATPARPITEVQIVTATPFQSVSAVTASSTPSSLPRPTSTLVVQKPTDVPRAVVQSDLVTLIDQRCTGKQDDMTCVFTAKNAGSNLVGSARFDINVFDPQGIKISSTYVSFDNLFPGETRKALTHIGAPSGTTFAKYTVGDVRTSDLFKVTAFDTSPFQVSNIEFNTGTYSNSVIAIVSNISNKTISNAKVTAILYDKAGNFIGGSDTWEDFPPNGKVRVSISVYSVNGTVSKAEVYPEIANITSVK